MDPEDAERAARAARQEQLDRLEQYLAGEETSFPNHQGTELAYTYDPTVFNREKEDKVVFNKNTIFLSIAQRACEENETEELEEFLEKEPDVDITTATADGVSALHTACIEGSVKVASLLCQRDFDVNVVDIDWWTPLHTAAATGNWRLVRLLISNGADVAAVNSDGELPIDLADDEKTEEILEQEMVSAGFPDEARDELRGKPKAVFMERVKTAIEEVDDLDKIGTDGACMIHTAACNGWEDALKLLIQNGADVNAVDGENQTALHYAVFFGQIGIVKALAKAGIDPAIKNKYHEPAVQMTEDPMMIRTVQSLCQEKQPVDESEEEALKSKAVGRNYESSKRKTLTRKGEYSRMEAQQEKSLAKDLYAEIRFSGKDRRESEWQRRDEEVVYNKVVYTHVSFAEKNGDGKKSGMQRPDDIIEVDSEDEELMESTNKSKRAQATRAAVKSRPSIALPTEAPEESQDSCCVLS